MAPQYDKQHCSWEAALTKVTMIRGRNAHPNEMYIYRALCLMAQ